MGLAYELYHALLEVGHAAHRAGIPLNRVPIEIAQSSLDLWRRDEKVMMRYVALVLAGTQAGQGLLLYGQP